MGPPKSGRSISQQAFDEMVKENIDDLGMDPSEALQDAIETLTLQGVDLSGIVTCVPGEGSVKDNPVIQSLDRLKQLNSDSTDRIGDQNDVDEVIVLLDKLADLCSIEGSGNAAIAMKNGGLELVCSVCLKLRGGSDRGLVSAFETIASLLHDVQSSETFQKNGGPKMVMAILNDGAQNMKILNGGFSVVASAATGNEIVKESFMDLKIDELMIQILRTHGKGCIHSLYDAIQALLTPDDNRVVASQVYGYARRFAKIGIAEALVDLLKEGLSSPSLVSATMTLKAVAVNDEICRSIAASGGVDAVLRCIGDSGEQGNKIVARACCSLLSKLAGSDTNKSAIIEKGGMDRIIKLSARFFDDPSVLQEVMSIICVLSLRSPDNAARAIEAGAGDLAIQAMQRHPGAHQMQKSACMMIRNLVARNPENRTLLLNNGIEKIIRKAKENHTSCKDAATDALRDLGLDNYNL
ncbi:Armadillo repeat-containing protein 6 [Camellia lanceoleosa]|uniref:Armadillo repeat-containing protein 6 n=1 Tax=Camellia lanceoleosa TaxID=1840588 RepID=A0ACC0HMJ0_9ERIC|nr:Armadillo repeat-containing protein 6 [Camellia lanceoleosa]